MEEEVMEELKPATNKFGFWFKAGAGFTLGGLVVALGFYAIVGIIALAVGAH